MKLSSTKCVGLRAVIFFAAAPDEHLTATDIAVKWDCGPKKVAPYLDAAVVAGWLQREVKKGRGGSIYRAGPKLLAELGVKA